MGERAAGIAVTAILLIALLSPVLYSAAVNGLFKAPQPALTLPDNATQCVKDTAYMRANHQSFLMHERDEVVREGIRNVSHSLSNCKTCHTKRAEFCDRCHSYAGVSPECFECHYLP